MQAILESKPATPAECSRAAKILADLQRPDLAKVLLKKVLDANPTEQQLAALANQFGATMFLDLASQPDLCPEAKQLADAVVAANNRQLQDPKRLARLIKQLQDPAEDVRAQAVAGLQDARGAGVEALVARVGRRRRRASPDGPGRDGLRGRRPDAGGPGRRRTGNEGPGHPGPQPPAGRRKRRRSCWRRRAAAGSDPRVRAAADAVLTRLLGRTPSKEQAVQILLQAGHRLPPAAAADPRRKWTAAWPSGIGTRRRASARPPAMRSPTPRGCWRRALARDAFAIAPESRQVRQLYLATMLEEAVDRRGLAKGIDAEKDPVAREAAPARRRRLERRLGICLGEPAFGGGAIGAAQVLGQFAKAQDALRTGAGAGAAGASGLRPGPPRPHGGPGGDRGAATGRPAGRLQPRAGIALFLCRQQRRPPRPGRRPQRRRPAGTGRDAQRAGLPDRHGRRRPRGPPHGAGFARL